MKATPEGKRNLRILLTGATGLIGSHVGRLLVTEGCRAYAIIRKGSDTWRINDVLSSLEVLSCDLESGDLEPCVQSVRPDVCIHLAWFMKPGKNLAGLENIVSLCSSIRLALCLKDVGCKRLVVSGTCLEYDTDCGYLAEDSPTKPRNLYAASKLGPYGVLEQLSRTAGMHVTWLRLFYVYGPFEDERRLVPSVILSLLKTRKLR